MVERDREFGFRIGQLLSLFILHIYEIFKKRKSIFKETVVSTCLHSEDSAKGVSRSL